MVFSTSFWFFSFFFFFRSMDFCANQARHLSILSKCFDIGKSLTYTRALASNSMEARMRNLTENYLEKRESSWSQITKVIGRTQFILKTSSLFLFLHFCHSLAVNLFVFTRCTVCIMYICVCVCVIVAQRCWWTYEWC